MPTTRVMVFVDYWNFQLHLNQACNDPKFKVDWRGLGSVLARKACELVDVSDHSFDGAFVYTSYNPAKEEDKKFRRWAVDWLGKQPGLTVECRERKPKSKPRCPSCHAEVRTCPKCNVDFNASTEKGVDTLIATDMIRLAWEGAYDLAVLATSDADLVPAVEFLRLKAKKVVQAGFPPIGADLARVSYASIDVRRFAGELSRD